MNKTYIFGNVSCTKKDGKYYDFYWDLEHNIRPAIATLTLTMMDYKLLQEQYNLADFEILDGCYFRSAIGIFDNYIDLKSFFFIFLSPLLPSKLKNKYR